MDEAKRVAGMLRDWLAREGLSRDAFAQRARLGRSTVDKLLVGLFSSRTLAAAEKATGLALRGAPVPTPSAPPSIAVLPFAFLGEAEGRAWLAEGLAEDIATALARLRWLFVIASNSTAAFRDPSADVRQAGRDLGVRYLLQGSLRIAGGRMRVAARLVEAATGAHLWAERYDRDPTDVFAVQDDMAAHVVAAIEPSLYAAEGFRAAARPPGGLDAWGLVVRAIGLIHRVGRRQNEEAQALLRQAIALEPGYARAHALLAWAVWWSAICGWVPDYAEARRHAEDAVALDPAEPWARMALGLCLSNERHFERGIAELRAALDLNPNFALGHANLGGGLLRAGLYEEAIAETGLALRLSPLDSFAGIYTALHGRCLLAAGRFEEALPFLQASIAAFTDYPRHHNTLIACLGHLGRPEDARAAIARRETLPPPLTRTAIGRELEGFAYRALLLDGLRKAGVPE
ncbi:tetratricopeptide repeat protein [Neoroseomonas oryzicola]|uniref:Tetratricopeptide repeat protein n=1 Tax=Neoroseomonas oryzicola TaxID=535904 RepID=A0A9X9WNT6_9PROT|nr:tetratricopeptide repeat protein [Neoroseomonas oryzicola]MBR0661996.1 tetratricopeptide repeat protein [Neoroseomonas oryzicola]NKE16803.1 tetratricopeptide repeat protein [Neoroseomonas oryzicola]